MSLEHYVIRGGLGDLERLKLLARIMRPSTLSLLEHRGVPRDATCLDVGCGGGAVTFDLARVIAPRGRVVGVDLDEENLESARAEARDRGIHNLEFRTAAADGSLGDAVFDLVYARFLLTHLSDPAACIDRMRTAARPGGLLVVEDIDMSGCFSYPESPAYRRFIDLYTEVVRQRGADANIGPRLPLLLLDAGLEHVDLHVVQPAGLAGEVKLLMPMSMENSADAILMHGLASREEIEELVASMYRFSRDARTVLGVPRVVQAWGRRSCGSQAAGAESEASRR